jgi:hypothetical protein
MNAHAHADVDLKTLPAREALRAAIVTAEVSTAHLRQAAATLARADRLATDAQRRLDVLGDVDGQVLAHATVAYRTFAEIGGERPNISTPQYLAERQRQRDVAQQELAAAKAAQAEIAAEHASTLIEHNQCEREVATAADAVVADMVLPALGRYVQAIEAARIAWDDVASIAGMVVQRGTRWVDRVPMPGVPDGVREVLDRGFGNLAGPLLGERVASRRSTDWEDFRRRLRQDANARII